MMTRYLMFISYLGTRFRGVQKQVPRNKPDIDDPFTVQGMLEIALKKVKPVNVPQVVLSSRTDAGVHAFRTAIHVDLETSHKFDVCFQLTRGINRFFDKSCIAIRVLDCQVVPETFHARYSAIKRSYLYRLAVRREDSPPVVANLTAQIPISDWRRCHFIQNPVFDLEKFSTTASLFPGEKDFRTFMGTVRSNCGKEHSSVRVLHSIDITPGVPTIPSCICPVSGYYNYWDIVICSKSFVYRQVRRMVGVLVAVAQGNLLHSDVEHMLSEPSPNNWKSSIVPAPAFGLYMLNVEYDPQDLLLENEKVISNTEDGDLPKKACTSQIS